MQTLKTDTYLLLLPALCASLPMAFVSRLGAIPGASRLE